MPHISVFVTVAAQLILIKSRALLPRPPVAVRWVAGPDPEEELRERLLEYRRYRDAGRARRAARLGRASSPRAAAATASGARRGAPRTAAARPVAAGLARGQPRVVPPPPPPEEVMPRTVTLASARPSSAPRCAGRPRSCSRSSCRACATASSWP